MNEVCLKYCLSVSCLDPNEIILFSGFNNVKLMHSLEVWLDPRTGNPDPLVITGCAMGGGRVPPTTPSSPLHQADPRHQVHAAAMNTKLLLLLPLATRGLLLHGQRMPLRLGAVRSRVLMVDVPKTLDNRRKRPEEPEVSKYGMDPRELAIEQAGEICPIPPASVRPGAVGVIENVGQLQAAIDLADAQVFERTSPTGAAPVSLTTCCDCLPATQSPHLQGGFVAIKFVRDGCAACASTAKLLEVWQS